MASSSTSADSSNIKRVRYGSLLSLKRPATIHNNIQIVPPKGYDDEGKLPESLPPTPIIDLVTEDEADIERTPRRQPQAQPKAEIEPEAEPQPQPPAQPQPQVQLQQPPRPTLEELNPEDLENEVGPFQLPPPPLHPLRARGGKNMAVVMASVRERQDQYSPISTATQSPPASPASSGPASPVLGQVQRREDGNVLRFIEEAQQRVERERRQMTQMVPAIQRRRGRIEEDLAAMGEQLAALQRAMEEKAIALQQCDAELEGIANFCR